MHIIQCRGRIALQHREAEHAEKTTINNISLYYYFFIAHRQKRIISVVHPYSKFNFRQIFYHCVCHWFRHGIPGPDLAIKWYLVPYFVYPFLVIMKLVVAAFVLYPQQDQYGGRHANGQSCNIDEGKTFIPEKVPVCDLEI